MPSRVHVRGFFWDEQNEEKVGLHGFRPEDIDAVLTQRFVLVRNRKGRRGAYLVVGRAVGGRYVTVVIEPFPGDSEVWRPVTAWPSKRSEVSHLR